MELGADIAVKQAIERQKFTVSAIKDTADREKQIANLLDEAVRSAPVSGARGANVNFTA